MKSLKLFAFSFAGLFFCGASFAATWILTPSSGPLTTWMWENVNLSNNTSFPVVPNILYIDDRANAKSGNGYIVNSDSNNLQITVGYTSSEPPLPVSIVCDYTGKFNAKSNTASGTYICNNSPSTKNWSAIVVS